MTKSKTILYWVLGFIFSFAILLRTVVFAVRNEFEDDECRLILAFTDKSWWQMFLCIGNAQSAPPFLIIPERLWGNLWNYNEYALKLLPYLCSIGSIFVFHKLTGKYFQHQYSRVAADLLFAINLPVIIFSPIVKQYTPDILIGLLCAYFLPEINILNLDRKGLIKLAVLLILLPFVSLPSLFFIGAFIIINALNGLSSVKRLGIILCPFIIIMGLYYFFNLVPSKASLDTYFPNYWNDGFINIHNFLQVMVVHFRYVFYPNVFTLFELILFVAGLAFFIKEKSTYAKFTLILFGLILLASVLKLYPLMSRVALYSIPFIIIACIKPLDSIKLKSYWFILLCLLYLVGFSKYNLTFFQKVFANEFYVDYAPKTLMADLIDKYNPKTDVVLCNNASSSSFLFYASQANFLPAKLEELPKFSGLEEYLNTLPKGNNYWFYLIKDYPKAPMFPMIMKWSENENLIYGIQRKDSYLFLIQR